MKVAFLVTIGLAVMSAPLFAQQPPDASAPPAAPAFSAGGPGAAAAAPSPYQSIARLTALVEQQQAYIGELEAYVAKLNEYVRGTSAKRR